MENKETILFNTIILHPHWGQFVINELPLILLCLASFVIKVFMDFPFHELFVYPALFLGFYLFFQVIYMARIEYVVNEEQLVTLRGVLSRSTDYIELYRVIDYQQHQSFLQQVFGLKTITIYSGDRNTPQLKIVGIKAKLDIIQTIRMRVEFNKKRKSIYEITNN